MKNKKKKVMIAPSFRDYLSEELKDPKFRKSYEKERLKFFLGYQIHKLRKKAGMSQAELARKIGTKQSNISRLEFGNLNFSLQMLGKIADALDAEIKCDLIPSRKSRAA